jgi:CDP-4-dehydro-6-deoxyglucose reductase, E1
MSYRVPYAGPMWGETEIQAVVDVLRDPSRQIAPGPRVREFEGRVASLFGQRHGVMTNSGSSANLLALASLDLPQGATVLTPALTFATAVAPILQLGLRPVFVDVEPGTYVTGDLSDYAAHAALVPLLLGNVPDLRPVACPLVVDACDTLGNSVPEADVVTTSFYASHVITAAGGGGMVCFPAKDQARADRARLLAYWGRRSTLLPSDAIEDRYVGELLAGVEYDTKFLFTEVGFNMQPLELQAAFGLAQLKRLPEFLAVRTRNFAALLHFFSAYEDRFVLPRASPRANWLAFPLTVRPEAGFTRLDFVRHLEAHGIQTRPIMAGNILRQPAYAHLGDPDRYPVADAVMRGGILLGCHQAMGETELMHVMSVAQEFLR